MDEREDRLFQALADPTRRQIIALVLGQEMSVSQLAQQFPMSFAAVQKHVAILERAGLVTKERAGREMRVRGAPAALDDARTAIERLELLWRQRVAAIERLLGEPENPEPETPGNEGDSR